MQLTLNDYLPATERIGAINDERKPKAVSKEVWASLKGVLMTAPSLVDDVAGFEKACNIINSFGTFKESEAYDRLIGEQVQIFKAGQDHSGIVKHTLKKGQLISSVLSTEYLTDKGAAKKSKASLQKKYGQNGYIVEVNKKLRFYKAELVNLQNLAIHIKKMGVLNNAG